MWKLWTELEIWWLDVQLDGPSGLLPWTLGAAIMLPLVSFLAIKVAFWIGRMEFAEQVLSSPVFIVRRSSSTLLLGLVVSAVVIGVIFLLGSVLLGSDIPP